MKKSILAICGVFTVWVAHAEPPSSNLVAKLAAAITNLCPKAEIKVDEYGFSAKHDTMTYTLHSRSKTGQVYPQTYQQEGPAYRGFILSVSLNDGTYEGAACVPQTLQGPYYPTFIDAPSTEDGKKHYQVHFSYGARLDPELKKAIFEATPKTTFQTPPANDRATTPTEKDKSR